MSITTSPPPAQVANSQPHRPSLKKWLVIAALMLLLALGYYVPSFVTSHSEPFTESVLTALTNWSLVPTDAEFYQSWQAVGASYRAGQLPMWAAVAGQPLLEATSGPVFYPGLMLAYLVPIGWGGLVFYLFHFWWLGCGLVGLRVAYRPGRKAGFWLVLVGIAFLVVAGSLRTDWLAALSWLPLALLLAHWRRRALAWLVLPFPLAFIALTAPSSLTLALFFVIIVYWLIRTNYSSQTGPSLIPHPSSLTTLSLLALSVLAGLCLGAPQLFPRLIYGGPAYNPGLNSALSFRAEASGAQVTRVQQQSDGQVLINLSIEAGAERVEVLLRGRAASGSNSSTNEEKATGWGGQLYNAGGTKGPEVKVSGKSPDGDQRLVMIFEAEKRPTRPTDYTIRLRYNPLAFTLGLYAAFLAFVSQGLLLVALLWTRFYREEEGDHPLRRVVKNSTTPLFAQLSGKIIDFGYAIFVLRLLGPDGNGQYVVAVTTWLFFATLCDFGLESLVTREVARARQLPDADAQVNRLFVTKLFLRLGFSLAALPLSLLWIAGFGLSGNLTAASSWAIILLMLGFLPSAITGSITVIFRGYEKFEYLAAGQLLIAVIKVPLGLSTLLMGWGVVGLAASSIAVNCVHVVVLNVLMRRLLFKAQVSFKAFDKKLAWQLLAQSYPLMLNGLIISILFKSDGLILQLLQGNVQLGLYNSAYKFIDALLIIPSTLTMALFPLFSTYGAADKENLLRAYREGLRLLLLIALPISAGTLFVAHDLINVMGGPQYLPGGAIALQILIWFFPFSCINGITQYVLIAIDKQRSITWAIIIAAVSNISLNVLLIPYWGYAAAAALTIVTELILLVPFCLIMYRALGAGAVPLLATAWRPTLAAGAMIGVLGGLLLAGINHFVITLVVGALVYLGVLTSLKAVTRQDLMLLKKVLKR